MLVEVARLECELQNKEMEIAQLKTKVTDLKQLVNDSIVLKTENNRMKQTIAGLEAEVSTSKAEHEACKNSHDQRVKEYEATVKAANAEVDRMKAAVEALTTQLKSNESLQQQFKDQTRHGNHQLHLVRYNNTDVHIAGELVSELEKLQVQSAAMKEKEEGLRKDLKLEKEKSSKLVQELGQGTYIRWLNDMH